MMRPRTLSIGGKIALASFAALALLGVLTATMLRTLGDLDRLALHTLAVHEAESQTGTALLAARTAQISALELQGQQTTDRVEQSLTAARRQIERAQSDLKEADSIAPAESKTLIARALTALAAYRTAIERTAELRTTVLAERDNTFLTVQSRFESTVGATRRDLGLEDLMPSEMEELQEHVRVYQLTLLSMRDATNRFLATGDAGLSERVTAADLASETHVPAILSARISDDFRETVEDMAASGLKLRQSARRLFDAALGVAAFSTGPAAAAAMSLEADVGAVARVFDASTETALAEAGAAQAAARVTLLWLAGGIALVMLISGFLTVRAIARPIAAMTRAVQDMAAGRTDIIIGYAGRGDEVGRMAEALEVLRQAVGKAFVQSQMIEQMPLGIATAAVAEGFRIGFANPELARLLQEAGVDLPVAAGALAGQSIDVLFDEPGMLNAVIADPALLPHRLRTTAGRSSFEVSISALRTRDGTYAGPMLAWRDITGETGMAGRFERSIGRVVGEVGAAAAAMQATAADMTAATAASGERLMLVAGASREATMSVQSVASNAEQLAHSVEAIARSVAESAAIARNAVAEAEATDHSVAGLSEAAGRIGDVVRLISDIAERTNLLALNATIEAARAGDAGRGFAVVASEVKTLANQTAKATGEIASQITAMQGATGQAVGALRSIGTTIQRMHDISGAIAAAVSQQGAATQEIARAVQQAAAGTAGVDANIGEVTGAVQRTGEQAAGFAAAATQLSAQSVQLADEVKDFLDHLQAA
ncbi:MAG: HAMP domain-containing methyl-accepting chemotaxis protein [Alphaproteobacteria bacterium]|nr:HAMP domain-containing methyl-accepting chemotaxis protein [Alphaproteobacteria bacterium]